ncbi:hydroxymethylbilane synthase [Paenibacillus sp. Marseille-P2973]|uniref:hydroxymethylbilane synthase n=1 Tax=Paenibacillus sp. Marseille-P2973 TaxID=1871032 RepID=UPI001B38162E|nr:hydroxymethylbilane synthase [Paenibacillus sp. Marseille-P2973]MBQ4900581.1 hydroxymethylbilane synthase [Paenibacillus sp. Marseille-P2973]
MRRTIIVGTRQSQLALTQTGHVIEALKAICEEHRLPYDFVIKKIVTKGDRILDVTLSKVGGKGLFVKEIEQAMLDGEIDLAVHSMKDMPSELPEGLVNGAVPKRVDPRDAFISREGISLDELPQGAKVGTSSLRRSSQLSAYRPDLVIEPIRGNIDSRLRKLETEGFDAIILATAGLFRMGWEDKITSYLPVDICLPAVGQGALGIECRENDEEVRHLLSLYNDPETALTVAAERTFLSVLGGSCQVPIGAYAVLGKNKQEDSEDGLSGEMVLTGMVGTPDGRLVLKESMAGNDPVLLGQSVADKLVSRGAGEILAAAEE